jgi:hypothetical protein
MANTGITPHMALEIANLAALSSVSGNSEGSIFRGQDGNAYQVINGQSVRVSNDKLLVKGIKPLPDTITVDYMTFHRDQTGKVYLVQNGQYVPLSQEAFQKLNAEKFGGQLEVRLEQEGRKILAQQELQQKYLYLGAGFLVLILLLRG